MATIPIGSPVPRVLPDAQQNRVITMDTSGQARAAQQIAGSVTQAGLGILDEQQRENQALARVKASNALLERETQINTITSDLAEQVRLGNITYDQMETSYNSAVEKLDPISSPGLSIPEQEGLGISAKRFQIKGLDDVRRFSVAARKDAAAGDMAVRMDALGKDAARPGANIDQINARMDSEDVDIAGRLAYGEMWAAKKQQFKDDNWTTHATQRVVSAREGLGELQKIEQDLTSEEGFYAGKLDPEKRNQLLNTVTGRIFQVKEHNARQAEIRENRAERALFQMDQQAATGVPATPADQQRWKNMTAGTSVASEYNSRLAQINEVQTLLRRPIPEQQEYVNQKRQQMLENGGSVSGQANLNRLQSAIDNNLKMLKADPLSFNAMRTGSDVEPLDLTDIATPDGQQRLVGQIESRFDVTNAVRKSYGPEVSRVPFKAQELEALRAGYDASDDKTRLGILGAVGSAAPTGSDAAAAIRAIAPDQPLALLAGMAQYRGLKSSDGTDVAKTLINGGRILGDKSIAIPSDEIMRAAFEERVGGALQGGTQQREQAYQGFSALYVGLAEASGKRYDPNTLALDSSLANKAVDMVTGGVISRGGGWFGDAPAHKVIKPYGMSDDAFNRTVDGQINAASAASGLPANQLENMAMSAVPGSEGAYYLLNAGRIQLNPKTNQPIVIQVNVK